MSKICKEGFSFRVLGGSTIYCCFFDIIDKVHLYPEDIAYLMDEMDSLCLDCEIPLKYHETVIRCKKHKKLS